MACKGRHTKVATRNHALWRMTGVGRNLKEEREVLREQTTMTTPNRAQMQENHPPGLRERRKWRKMLLQSQVIAGPGRFQNRGKTKFNGGKHGLMLGLTEPRGAPAVIQQSSFIYFRSQSCLRQQILGRNFLRKIHRSCSKREQSLWQQLKNVWDLDGDGKLQKETKSKREKAILFFRGILISWNNGLTQFISFHFPGY